MWCFLVLYVSVLLLQCVSVCVGVRACMRACVRVMAAWLSVADSCWAG